MGVYGALFPANATIKGVAIDPTCINIMTTTLGKRQERDYSGETSTHVKSFDYICIMDRRVNRQSDAQMHAGKGLPAHL